MAHLFLIEDAPEVAQVVRILCRRAGHTFTWNADGTSLDLTQRPDLVLLDLNLADEDGIELYRRLAQPSHPLHQLLTALFTQGASPARIAAGLDAGIDFLVSKELLGRPDDWNRRIDEVLAARALPASCNDILTLSDGMLSRAIRHPVLLRLGDEVIAAMLRRALTRLPAFRPLPNSAVDVALSNANLAQDIAHLESISPDLIAPLVHGLVRQAECLLGRDVSAPLRQALMAAQS